MVPIVTTGVLIVEKKLSSRVILVLGAKLIFQYRSTGDPRSVRVILAPEPCNFHRIEKKRIHAKSFHQYLHSRIVRVSLAEWSCQVLQILDVSSKQVPCYVSSLHKGPRTFSLRKEKTCDRFHVEERKSSFLRRIPNNLRSAFP